MNYESRAGRAREARGALHRGGLRDAASPEGAQAAGLCALDSYGMLSIGVGQVQAATPPPPATPDNWKSAVSGNWTTGVDWSLGAAPTSSNDATIAIAGSYTVTINSPVSVTSLTINDSTGVVAADGGTLAIATTLVVTAGTLSLADAATIVGGTISVGSTGVVATNNGIFSGVSLLGTVNLGATGLLLVEGGLNIASGGNCVIEDNGSSSYLEFQNTETVNNMTIKIGNADEFSQLEFGGNTGTAQTLTLGHQVVISATGANAAISFDDTKLPAGGNELINEGTITAATSGGVLMITDEYGNATFINHGVLQATAGATLLLGANLTTAELGSFMTAGSGVIELANGDTLSNGGATLHLGVTSALELEANATIAGGTIDDTGGGLSSEFGGTLSGVACLGAIDLNAVGIPNLLTLSDVTCLGTINLAGNVVPQALYVDNGLDGSVGTAVGEINLSGGGDLNFEGGQLVNNIVINLSGNSSAGNGYNTGTVSSTLTLGSKVEIGSVGQAYFFLDDSSTIAGDTLINEGTITNNGDLSFYSFSNLSTFTNGGTIINYGFVSFGGHSCAFTNAVGTTLLGGVFETYSNSTMALLISEVVVDASTLILSGAGSEIEASGTGNLVPIDQTLGTIASNGTLELLAGRNFTAAGALVDDGALALVGGTLTAASGLAIDGSMLFAGGMVSTDSGLTIGSGGDLLGYGAIEGAITNAGVLLAESGVLIIDGAITGGGTLQVSAGAVLDAAGGGSVGGGISGAGTLQIDGSNSLVLQSAGDLTISKVVVDAAATLELTQGGALNGTISGAGTLQLDGATEYTLAAGTALTIGTAAVETGATLSGNGTLSGAVSDAGTVNAAGGTLTIDGAVTGGGVLSAPTTRVLDLAGGGDFSGTVSGAGTLKLDGGNAFTLIDATVSIASVVVDAGATLAGDGTVSGAVTNNGTIVATGGKLVLSGAIGGAGVLQATAGATLDLTHGGVLSEAIGGAGTLELGGAFTLGAAAPTIAALIVDKGASLGGAGKIAGTATDDGMVVATGGTLTLAGVLSGSGTLSAAAGAVLDLAGGGSFGGAITGAGMVEIGAALTLTDGAILSASHVVETANLTLGAGEKLSIGAGDSFAMSASAGTTEKLSGKGADRLSNAGSFLANGPGTSDVNVAFINAANVTVSSGTLAFLKAVTNSGTIDVSAGVASFKTDVGGTGLLEVGASGMLSLLAGAGSGQTVDFLAGTGLLDLSKSLYFAGAIEGFAGGDKVDLIDKAATSLSFAGGVLTVKDDGTAVARLHFDGSYSSASFSLAADGHGGTFITLS